MKKLNKKHSMKMTWGCMALAVLARLVIRGVGAGALFIIQWC